MAKKSSGEWKDPRSKGSSGSGTSGWWSSPAVSYAPKSSGNAWAQQNLSPNYMGGLGNVYGQYEQLGPQMDEDWAGAQPKSLADLYQGYTEGNPELEQMQYNQALARLKGQMGTGMQNLMGAAGARMGGANSGMFQGGLEDLNRGFMQGVGQIGIAQAMKQMEDRERRQKEYIGYQGQDIANKQGWLQNMTQAKLGGLGQYGQFVQGQFPMEQWSIQYPKQMAMQAASAKSNRAAQEEQINAQRRAEAWGQMQYMNEQAWKQKEFDANNYYRGQQGWLDYGGQRGAAILPGYGQGQNPYA